MMPAYLNGFAESTVFGQSVVIASNCAIGVPPMANGANRRPIDGNLSCVRIGDGCIIGFFSVIYLDVHMGEQCRVGDHATIREGCRIGARCVIGTNADVQYGVTIGDDVRIMNGAHITGGSVIGSGTFVGPGVMTANDRHVDLMDYRDHDKRRGVTIGERVMIGVGAILLPGVHVGDGALIGAGALVAKDVEPNGIVTSDIVARARNMMGR